MSRLILESKFSAETRAEVFDFTSSLAAGETISAASVTATTYSGTDAAPSAIISGPATFSGAKVTQNLVAGVEGVIYLLTCSVDTSAAQTLKLHAFLAIVPPGY